jgi:hypothetical protein
MKEKKKSPLPLQRRENLEGWGKTKKQSPSVSCKGKRSEFQRK